MDKYSNRSDSEKRRLSDAATRSWRRDINEQPPMKLLLNPRYMCYPFVSEAMSPSLPGFVNSVVTVASEYHGTTYYHQYYAPVYHPNLIKSSGYSIQTVDAIQTVKHAQLAADKSAVAFFKRKDNMHDPVNWTLVKNMASAYQEYQKDLVVKKSEKEKHAASVDALLRNPESKKKSKDFSLLEKANLGIRLKLID
ncbi:hypothetical protein CAPTEDRAFT_210683 [Capitella teleta]|uniref:Uncharacterized protein n=1 Tax=Capitella teleta TaxID=283909 RepID=R7UHV0_CAPTE|nr:hypothetical protein CAPTEDRAFT_210683 [Capitella teleta]|eukprot:ELU02852.1 hypothetical protein CAPTEDRAFT_210683 [Capitella teleta]